MEQDRVTNGVYELNGYSSISHLQDLLHWLREDYRSHGRNPQHIRRDVLAYARLQGRLRNFSYGDLVRFHVNRLLIARRDEKIGAPNDNDPDCRTLEQLEAITTSPEQHDACINRAKLTDADFPRVIWRPFALVSRVKNWDIDELDAAVHRGRPYY